MHKLTVATILDHAGFTPHTDYILTREQGHHDFTNYEEEVPLHDGEKFSTRFTGVVTYSCMPSENSMTTTEPLRGARTSRPTTAREPLPSFRRTTCTL